jgi:uncharacterized protein YbjT (DUF2867 family)
MILLTGITGTTGKQVLKLLSGKNVPLRALVRDPDKLGELSVSNIEIIQGDLEDEVAVENALKGVDKAFLLMANVEQQLENEKRFIDVASRLNISHLVKLSASGADSNSAVALKRYHGESEEYLAQSGLGYTSIRPDFYMQNMLHSAGSIVAEDRFYLPFRKGETACIDVSDVAAFVAAILTEAGHEGKTYYITGPEIFSFYDLAAQMSDVLDREITYVDLPAEEFRSQLLNWGSSDWYVNAVMDMFELIAQGKGAQITDTFQKVIGRAPRPFRQFVQDHAAVFSAS